MILQLKIKLFFGCALCFAILGTNSHCNAQVPVDEEGPPMLDPIHPFPGTCLVRDSAQDCESLMGGVEFGDEDQCAGCTTVGAACSGDSYAVPNPLLDANQYSKNRALSVKQVPGDGYAKGLGDAIICGIIGVCDRPCAQGAIGSQAQRFCPVRTEPTGTMYFWNLSGTCKKLVPVPIPDPLPVNVP